MPARPLDHLTIFFGEASAAEARVYARLPSEGLPAGATLGGKIVGPECAFAQTLPTTVRLADRGPGATLLAETILPDPCCWTSELPFLYRAEIILRHGANVLATTERVFGIRRLAPRGRSLSFEGQRWVLRGIAIENVGDETIFADCRELAAALWLDQADDRVCELASRQGTLLALNVAGNAEHIMAKVHRLARWPAVGMVVFAAGIAFPSGLRGLAPNLIFAEYFSSSEAVRPSSWAQAALCEVAAIDALPARIAGCSLPIIATRKAESYNSLAEARRGCDALQSDLAATGDFAGYVTRAKG